MHILHLCRLFTPHIGGVETHVEQVTRIQQQRGHSVTVVTTQHDVTVPLTEQRADGITVVRMSAADSEQKLPTWRWVLAHAELFRQADVIQVHDVYWWLLPLYWQNRTKIVSTFHGWETQWPIPLSAKLQRRVYSTLSAKVVHVGGWIEQFYGDKPDAVIYGGVEERFLEVPPPALYTPKRPLQIVFLGRLEQDTGVLQYIEFIVALRKTGQPVQLTWVGDGSLRSECEAVGTVVGWQNNPLKWLRVSDIVCASSYLSMLQAQAAGRLVISMYANELKKQYLRTYRGSQYCVISDSATVAAEQLAQLLAEPERLRELQTGAKTFAATQTWQHIADEYKELWQH